jgi:hypothetical protein
MKYERSMLLVIAAALFLPPFFFPAQAQGPAAAAPAIERFDLDPPQRLVPGEALIFRLTGSPRANASVSIEGVNRKVALREVMPGIYEGVYTIRKGDQISVDSAVTGNLRRGTLELSAALGEPLVETSTAVAASR